MNGYIIQPRTLQTLQSVNVLSYELPLDVAAGATGSVTIENKMKTDMSRMLFRLEGLPEWFKISDMQTGNENTVTLSLSNAISILENTDQLAVVRAEGEAYNAGNVTDLVVGTGGRFPLWFIDQGSYKLTRGSPNYYAPEFVCSRFNGRFAMNGNDVMTEWGHTVRDSGLQFADLVSDKLYTLNNEYYYTANDENILYKLIEYGFRVKMSFEPLPVLVDIHDIGARPVFVVDIFYDGPQEARKIITGDGHTELLSESYSNDVVSHVFVYTKSTSGLLSCDCYLNADQTATLDRREQIPGKSTSLLLETPIKNEAVALDAAAGVFAANSYQHKIEFASDLRLSMGQPVKMLLSRGVLDTAVSSVVKKSGDNRYYYTCGDLPVTATDNIKASAWKYGRRLPTQPRKGQLFILG